MIDERRRLMMGLGEEDEAVLMWIPLIKNVVAYDPGFNVEPGEKIYAIFSPDGAYTSSDLRLYFSDVSTSSFSSSGSFASGYTKGIALRTYTSLGPSARAYPGTNTKYNTGIITYGKNLGESYGTQDGYLFEFSTWPYFSGTKPEFLYLNSRSSTVPNYTDSLKLFALVKRKAVLLSVSSSQSATGPSSGTITVYLKADGTTITGGSSSDFTVSSAFGSTLQSYDSSTGAITISYPANTTTENIVDAISIGYGGSEALFKLTHRALIRIWVNKPVITTGSDAVRVFNNSMEIENPATNCSFQFSSRYLYASNYSVGFVISTSNLIADNSTQFIKITYSDGFTSDSTVVVRKASSETKDVLVYKASAKINQTTSSSNSGIFTDKLGGVTITSHEYNSTFLTGVVHFSSSPTNLGMFIIGSETELVFPYSVLSWGGNSVYNNTSLTKLYLGLNLSQITVLLFANLKELTVTPLSPPSLGAGSSLPSDCKVYVNGAHLDDYKSNNNWNQYAGSRLTGIWNL